VVSVEQWAEFAQGMEPFMELSGSRRPLRKLVMRAPWAGPSRPSESPGLRLTAPARSFFESLPTRSRYLEAVEARHILRPSSRVSGTSRPAMILLGYSQSSEPAIPCGIRELAAAIRAARPARDRSANPRRLSRDWPRASGDNWPFRRHRVTLRLSPCPRSRRTGTLLGRTP
jgi:hypothetical protein